LSPGGTTRQTNAQSIGADVQLKDEAGAMPTYSGGCGTATSHRTVR
jgi:hypothetical protein